LAAETPELPDPPPEPPPLVLLPPPPLLLLLLLHAAIPSDAVRATAATTVFLITRLSWPGSS
jgi:hypothetical protein